MARTLLHLALSAVLAVVSVVVAVQFLWIIVRSEQQTVNGLSQPLRWINQLRDYFGENLLLLVFWMFLSLLYFVILQSWFYSYFNRMNSAVRNMADGTFDLNYQLAVKRSPFGEMAGNVNKLAGRLQHALEEERRAEQTKNELITNVSHDLRTPLTSVLGYLGLIEQDRCRDEVEMRQYVQIAYEKSQRLNVLINDLFEYTRMRHTVASYKETSLNLIELLGELLAQYRMPLAEAGMAGELRTKETSIVVRGDALKLVRVFENLIANAMNYGRAGKQMIIAVEIAGDLAVTEVINFGEPISSFDLPHIFDRFYRVDKSRTEWEGGSGLGLAIAKSIVDGHGGTISVTSDMDGTAFRVALPIVKQF
jgi:signal transduction histidine kinase